eukprot:2164087-Amphidinium_carterae.1
MVLKSSTSKTGSSTDTKPLTDQTPASKQLINDHLYRQAPASWQLRRQCHEPCDPPLANSKLQSMPGVMLAMIL